MTANHRPANAISIPSGNHSSEFTAAQDGVRAVGAAWLGQTTGCAQCNDHKFDPFTTRDYYALGAFFADVKEAPVGRREAAIVSHIRGKIGALWAARGRHATCLETYPRWKRKCLTTLHPGSVHKS